MAVSDEFTRRPKICRVITRLNIGGPSHHVAILSEGLDALGYETILIVGTEGKNEGSMMDQVTKRNIRIVVVPELTRMVSLKDFKAAYSLAKLFRLERPQIVHTHLSKAGLLGRIAARLSGVPIIVHTYHNFTFRDYFHPFLSRLFLFLDIACAKITSCVVAISYRQRSDLLKLKVASSNKIKVIPLGLELGKFSKCGNSTDSELDLPRGVRLVGAVGRLVPIKNLHLFLSAAASVRQVRKDIEFVLVGDGESRPELEQFTQSLGIKEAVHFTGWVKNVDTVYSRLDLVVISSDSEGTPVSLIESMASGCPVISTDVGGVADVVQDGKTGRLVPKGDTEALAKAILAVFDDPERTHEMARAGKEFVLNKFDKQRLIKDIDALYRDLLTQGATLQSHELTSSQL